MKIANASHSAVGAEYGGCNSRQWLPRYCIQVDGVPLEVYPNEACDKEVRISSDELTDVSILSEQTFDLTRGLYINKIWNSNNYLIFILHGFAAIIISTVFSSNMTTLLTKQVRYPEIDSMNDLVEADIFIQTTSIVATSMLELQEAIVAKLTDSLHAIMAFLNIEAIHNQEIAVYYVDPTSNLSMGTDTDDYLLKTIENAHAISETDAILQSIPQALVSKKNVDVRTSLWREKMNYHLMEQSLMTYPVLFTFPKDSFLFDKVNDLLIRFLEYGHAHEYLKEIMRQEFNVTTASDDDFCDKIEPKPHSLSDLQPAFAALIIGLFISFLAFAS
ncbi:unnamed protein product [Bemisia tabaci]|uniref:Ionotropic receptor n=1 Tax=Bemisia tabaci TaxID=7038 RepID=A0A9P0AJ28_BEMTA|nr:unnamed protein product [Bemisia tabaci]